MIPGCDDEVGQLIENPDADFVNSAIQRTQYFLERAAALCEVPPHVPEATKGSCRDCSFFWFAGLVRPSECCAEILVLVIEQIEPASLVRPDNFWTGTFREFAEISGVPIADRRSLAALPQ